MKKTILAAAALCATCLSANTFAQAQNFEGFAVTAATGYQSYQQKGSSFSTYITSADIGSNGGTPLVLGGDYTWGLNDKYTLALGYEMNTNNPSESNLTTKTTGSPGSGTAKLSSMTNLYVKPGMVLNKDALVYAKLGYVSGKSTFVGSDGVPADTNFNAYSIGVGYLQNLSKNLFAFGEINSLMALEKDATLPSSTITYKLKVDGTNALVGIGYRF
jgi:hypothetical protein